MSMDNLSSPGPIINTLYIDNNRFNYISNQNNKLNYYLII